MKVKNGSGPPCDYKLLWKFQNVTGFEKRGHLEQNRHYCYHFEAGNERSTIQFESCGDIVD
jgi:hypothetical protein